MLKIQIAYLIFIRFLARRSNFNSRFCVW